MQSFDTNINQAISDFERIKDKIVECGVEVADGTPTLNYAAKVGEVFEAGKAQGGDSYYDTFWDSTKDNYGEISGFLMYAFAGQVWNDTTFSPPYNIRPTYGGGLFAQSRITDLKGILERNDVVLDFSNSTNIGTIVEGSTITRLPEIDTRSAKRLGNFLYNAANLVSVDKVVLKDDGSQAINANAFRLLGALIEIRFEGLIGANINISDSKNLSAESYHSIITHCSKTASFSLTLPAEATVRSVYDAKYGSGAWDTITAEYSNLTISYM